MDGRRQEEERLAALQLGRHDLVLLGHPIVGPEVRSGDDLGGQGLMSEGPPAGADEHAGDGQPQPVLTSVAPLALVVSTAASSMPMPKSEPRR